MPYCNRCHHRWRTLPGEEQDHDCPHCGPPDQTITPEQYAAAAQRLGRQSTLSTGPEDAIVPDENRS